MKTAQNAKVIGTTGKSSQVWSLHEWLTALENLYEERFNEGEGPYLTVEFRLFCPNETIFRFLVVMNNSAVGMASLVTRRDGTGTASIGTVEDVYLLHPYRGQGLSKPLMEALIDQAMRIDLARLELTSKPRRKAANRLYQSLGFELVAKANPKLGDRATNFYRLILHR